MAQSGSNSGDSAIELTYNLSRNVAAASLREGEWETRKESHLSLSLSLPLSLSLGRGGRREGGREGGTEGRGTRKRVRSERSMIVERLTEPNPFQVGCLSAKNSIVNPPNGHAIVKCNAPVTRIDARQISVDE